MLCLSFHETISRAVFGFYVGMFELKLTQYVGAASKHTQQMYLNKLLVNKKCVRHFK